MSNKPRDGGDEDYARPAARFHAGCFEGSAEAGQGRAEPAAWAGADETQGQVERLQHAFETIGKCARGETCEAINGRIEEGDEVVEEFPAGVARDAGILACAQAATAPLSPGRKRWAPRMSHV
jgi:Domain of unknown function (DUF892)